MDLIFAIHFLFGLLLAIVGGFAFNVDCSYYNENYVLTNKEDFFGCIFCFQMFVWDTSKDYNINVIGAIIMEIFITIFSIYYNVFAFTTLMICFVIKYFCKFFVWLFKNRRTNNDKL